METALATRWLFVGGFLLAVACSFALAPYLGQNFFPPVANAQIKLHVRAPTGTRIEDTAALCDGVESAIRRIIPPDALGPIVDNIGLPVSGINQTYNNSGTVGPADADLLITVKPDYESEADGYIRKMRETLPRDFPGATFAFLPADIVSQILNFGLPAPIDVQIVGSNFAANHAYANELLKKIARVPGVADPRIQQSSNNPTFGVAVDRMRAAQVGLNEGDVAKSLQESLSGSFKVAPTFWINPKNGVAYPVVAQTPQYWLDSVSSLENIPASKEDSSQIVGGLATLKRGVSPSVVSHYAVQPVIDIYATNNERDLGAVSADIQRILDETAKDVPHGSSVVMRGQTETMTSAYQQLFVGIALAVVLIYLLIVVNFQSWLDPFVIVSALPTALAGIVWMLFVTRTTLSVPALTGAIMCMGVATANSILVVSFARERLAEGADADDRRDGCGIHPFQAGSDDGARDDHRHGADGAERRTERAARPGRDRRPDLLDGRDPVLRAGGVPPRPRAQAEARERSRRLLSVQRRRRYEARSSAEFGVETAADAGPSREGRPSDDPCSGQGRPRRHPVQRRRGRGRADRRSRPTSRRGEARALDG